MWKRSVLFNTLPPPPILKTREDIEGTAATNIIAPDYLQLTPDANKIDILVAYTPSALNRAGGKAALEAAIQAAIADTNTAFNESKVGSYRVRLAGIVAVAQEETDDWNADLTALRNTNDGKWDEVHALRQQYLADQVSLVTGLTGGTTAGNGYVGGGKGNAFTITKVSSFSSFSFSHELGHNLGLDHPDGLEILGRFRTIMAYGSAKRIPRYSNPNVLFNGLATGDATHNSVAKLIGTVPKVINYFKVFESNAKPPGCGTMKGEACEIFKSMNAERLQAGQFALEPSNECINMAQSHATDMATNNFFSQTSPTRGTASDRAKFYQLTSGWAENIAAGQTDIRSVFKNNTNILSPNYSYSGVGYARDSSGKPYYVLCLAG